MAIRPTEELLDDITKHALELQRLANNTSDRFISKQYKILAKDLESLTAQNAFVGLGTTKSQKKKIQKILQRGKVAIASTHRGLFDQVQDTLLEVGELETNFSARSINRAATGKGSIFIAENTLSPRKVSANANRLITQGMPQKELWKRHSRRVQDGFRDIIRGAYENNEDLATTVGRIRGTRARAFKDGLMRTSKNQASTLARTSILGMSNTIRQETYLANRDVINGVQFLAHLDSRTTIVCRAHSGDQWIYNPDGSLKNIRGGHDPVFPPLHWNCRSTLMPIVKTVGELSPVKAKKIPKERAKGMGAPVPRSKYTNADAWLKTQPEEYQKDVLGKAYNMWSAGKVSFQRFVSQKGRLRTPEELSRIYAKSELVPESILRLKTTGKFKPYPGATEAFKAELAATEKGEFLRIQERLMTGKTVSNTQSDLVGRIIKNADPEDLEFAKSFKPIDFQDLAGNKGKRLALYNHTAKRYSRFDKLAKGDLAKRKTGSLSEIDSLVKKELIDKINADTVMSQANKNMLLDMFDESSKIVGTQRSLPMVESLFTLARKSDFSEIKGDFLGYLQRSSENAVNSYFSRVTRLEIRIGQGVEKELRYATLSDAAKKGYFSGIKSEGQQLAHVSDVQKKITRIGTRKLREFSGTTATAETVNLELRAESAMTNYLSNIHEARMTDKQIKAWITRMKNKKQQIVSTRTAPGEQVLISDRFLKLKEFKHWDDNAWSGRGFPLEVRQEAGEVLGDVQIHNDLRQYLRGKVIAPRVIIEEGVNADEFIVSAMTKFMEDPSRLKLRLYQMDADRKIRNLYKLDGTARNKLRAARTEMASKDLESRGFFARLSRREDKLARAKAAEVRKAAAVDIMREEADVVFIDATVKHIDKGIRADVLSPRGPFFKQVNQLRSEDISKVARLANQEAFRVINSGGSYLDGVKSLGEKFYWQFKGMKVVDEDEAIRMGQFLMTRLEKAGIVERFKSVSMVRGFDWEAPKEQVMWLLKTKSKTWEEAILANRKNYEFDGLPYLKAPKYRRDGLYESGQAAIRGTDKEEVGKMLGRKSRPAMRDLDLEAGTGIKVNGYVYDVQTEMDRRGVGIGTAIPMKPTSKLDIVARSSRNSWDRVRKVAKSMRDETFYNGMSNDKYARTYANTTALHWQGDHVNKGLMLFDKGVKMGKYGEDAFKQEFINVSLNGFDKLPIKVRKQIYDSIPDKIVTATIKDPLKHDWWYKQTDWFEAGLLKKDLKGISKEWADEVRKLAMAGEPDGAWNFLSLLKERSEQIAWVKKGNKIEDFVSYKQLQVDGTTNVLQHLSGISRDYEMAKRVNMVAQPKVADAYIAVRDQLDDIARKLDNGDPRKKYIDQDTLELLHAKRRKSVKKGLMTYQYNAGPATLGDSYFEALEGVLVDGKPIFKTASKSDRLAIGRLIAQASDDVFPNSGNVKSLLNNFAEAHQIADKTTIEFNTELGFPFKQQYKKKGIRQLVLPDGQGGTMSLNISVDLDEMDWAKQNRAFAPNIIHAMDATHKSMVVNKLSKEYGVTNFSMIHDSFGSSAGHMKALNLTTRQTFEELYKDRVFMKELYDNFSKQGVPMKRFVRNEIGQKMRYTQTTALTGKQERFIQDGRSWIIEPIPLKEVLQQGDFNFKNFTELEYFFH